MTPPPLVAVCVGQPTRRCTRARCDAAARRCPRDVRARCDANRCFFCVFFFMPLRAYLFLQRVRHAWFPSVSVVLVRENDGSRKIHGASVRGRVDAIATRFCEAMNGDACLSLVELSVATHHRSIRNRFFSSFAAFSFPARFSARNGDSLLAALPCSAQPLERSFQRSRLTQHDQCYWL